MDTGIDQILARKAERDSIKKERKESGERQAVMVDKYPTGLYYCRYERGSVPKDLSGSFTSINKIISIATAKGLEIKRMF